MILAAILLGGTFMAITSLGLAGARRMASSDPVRVLGLLTAGFGVGQIIGPSLAGYLRERGLRRVFLAGLAFDFCVRYSAEDARREGLEAIVIEDACRGIDVDGSVDATRRRLTELNVQCVGEADIS